MAALTKLNSSFSSNQTETQRGAFLSVSLITFCEANVSLESFLLYTFLTFIFLCLRPQKNERMKQDDAMKLLTAEQQGHREKYLTAPVFGSFIA